MNRLIEILSGPAWREILLTLAHSLWQGAAIALVLALVLQRIAGNRPNLRYLASLAALAGMVLSCLVTWSILDLPAAESWSSTESAIDLQPAAAEPTPPATGTTAPTSASHAALRPSAVWQTAAALLSALWITGMAVMLGRMIWLLAGVHRLAKQPVVADPRVLEMVERLRRRLGILRRIAVVEAQAFGPAVLGVLRPVLLLPPALSGEMSAECLEAILAHELAHIRRHDYLVNLGQMLVEAALFFNPAVWWISRQVRREREASCDWLAARITGQPLTYADALAAWIERDCARQTSELALAWSKRGGSALDRIQRLVTAGYRPELRGTWPALAGGLALAALSLAALWSGTRAGVALAADILSPRERIEQLAKERDELRPLGEPDGKALVEGTVRTEDGSAPEMFHGWYVVTGPKNNLVKGMTLRSPDFSEMLPNGTTWFIVYAEGYAPTVLGPFSTKAGDVLDGLEAVLRPGFSAELRLTGPDGQPIADAKVTGVLSEPNSGPNFEWHAREPGVILLDHLADRAYKLTIEAPGFQTLRLEPTKFRDGSVSGYGLIPSSPTTGIVVTPEGQGVADAKIRRLAQSSPNFSDGIFGVVLGQTDEQGRFSLNNLDDGSHYALLVEAPDHSRQGFLNVRSGQTDLRWVVGPPIVVTGRIIGDDLSTLSMERGQRVVTYCQANSMNADGVTSLSVDFSYGSAPVKSTNGKNEFRITDVAPGKLCIYAGHRESKLDLTGPTAEITIDLTKPQPDAAMRHVILRFTGADPGTAASGQIWFSTNPRDGAFSTEWPMGERTIDDSRVEFDAPVGGSVYYRMENVVGYWFENANFDVPAGTEPLVQEVPLVAAGAIRGRILNTDGTSAADRSEASAGTVEERTKQIHMHNIPVDGDGRFFISPLPLGREYKVEVSRGFERAIAKPILVDSAHPNPTVELRYSPTADIRGRLLSPAGKGVADVEVSLASSYTAYAPGQFTDREGRFAFGAVSTGIGEYRIRVEPRRDFQPADLALPLDGSAADFRLKPGHVIEGHLIDDTTGKPIAGLKLAARPAKGPLSYPFPKPDEPKTDAKGHFRFSTLPKGRFGILVTEPYWAIRSPPPVDQVFHTGETNVELRVTPPETK